jgi:spermidine synthase
VPAGLIGAVLPLMIRLISHGESGLGAGVGRLLTWNTIGAVAGVLLTGFVIMPRVGLRAAFAALLLALCAVAGLLAWRQRLRVGLAASGLSAALLAVLFALTGDGWRHVMSSGVFRAREVEVDPQVMPLRKKHIQIVFYEDAPDATVSVEHGDGVGAPNDFGLRINGKADASSRGDLCTQLLVGHLPMLARPDARDVFILGLGSGITAGAILAHPVSQVTVGENCEPVVRAAQFFTPWNRGVLTNPLVRVSVEDARTVLKLSPQLYDVIITQPSNPWMAGVGSVFSREYYELAASRLKPGGIVAQWFQVYDMHDGIVSLVLRTFGAVFPHMEIWDTEAGDLVLLGSMAPWPDTPEHYRTAFERPLVRQDLVRVGLDSPAALLARQLASQRTAFAVAGNGPIQSDWNPILEYEAPRAFFLGRKAEQISLFDERTRQALLASDAKREALQSLDAPALQRIFSEFGTVNPELRQSLRYALLRASRPGREVISLDPIVPSLLAGGGRQSLTPFAVTNLEIAVAVLTTNPLRSGPELRAAVQLVEDALRNPPAAVAWAPELLGAAATRACLTEGDAARARKILQQALAIAPHDPQLGYLARIVDRTGVALTTASAPPTAAGR